MATVPHFKSSALQGLKHGFFGRLGGVSQGAMDSLNAYPYHRETKQQVDSADNVQENRRRILQALEIQANDVVTANQVHGDKIVHVQQQEPMDFTDADGLIVDQPNIPVGVLTADCVPVIYTDHTQSVAAIVHAGWKGAFLDIHLKMLERLEQLGYSTDQLVAAIGPSSQQLSYEVDQGFYDKWINKSDKYKEYFIAAKKKAHYQFDVSKVVHDELLGAGVADVDWIKVDTILNETLFFSHRRATLQKAPYAGRQLSVVCL